MSDRPLYEVVADHTVTTVGGWSQYGPNITAELAAVLKAAHNLRHAYFEPDDGMSDWHALDAAYDAAVADLRRALEGK